MARWHSLSHLRARFKPAPIDHRILMPTDIHGSLPVRIDGRCFEQLYPPDLHFLRPRVHCGQLSTGWVTERFQNRTLGEMRQIASLVVKRLDR